MSVSQRSKDVYSRYIDKNKIPPKTATSLIEFAETSDVNKPISYEMARKVIKYYKTHPMSKLQGKSCKPHIAAKTKGRPFSFIFDVCMTSMSNIISPIRQLLR